LDVDDTAPKQNKLFRYCELLRS